MARTQARGPQIKGVSLDPGSDDIDHSTVLGIDDGGTGQETAQAAINGLTAVSAATVGHALMKKDSGDAEYYNPKSNKITYNSSGGVGALRFNDWDKLMDYIAFYGADTDIILEQDETVPEGDWDFKRARWIGNNGLEYSSGGWTLYFGDNTTISNWETPSCSGLRLYSSNTTDHIFSTANPLILQLDSVSNVHSETIPFFEFSGSGQCTVKLDNNARWNKLSGGVENLEVTSSAFACQLIVYRGKGTSIQHDTIKSTNAVILIDLIADSAQEPTIWPLNPVNLVIGALVPIIFAYQTATTYIPVKKYSTDSPVAVTRAGALWLGDATGGLVNFNLMPATGSGLVQTFKKYDSSGNNVVVNRSGSDTIEGATSITLSAQWQSVTLVDAEAGLYVIRSTT